jgi:signal transduction histidine kinase
MDALVTAFLVRWAADATERRLILALAALALVASDLVNGSGLVQACGMVSLNLCEIAFAAWLVRKLGHPVDSLKAFAAFVVGSVLAVPVLTGLAAAALFALTDPRAEPLQVGLRWSSAVGLGMLIVGSFALTIRAPRHGESLAVWLQFLGGQAVVAAGISAILLAPGTPGLFMLYPFLVVGALSHREFGGVSAVALAALLICGATLLGRGPAVVADLVSVNRIGLMQLLLASMVFTVLPISALLRRLDVTAARLSERQERAEELNALKVRLLAYVSHEIRSPLSGVTALAQLMRDGALGELTPQQREGVDRIALAGAEVEQLARDLTDTAALQAGKARVSIAEVPVGEAIRSAVSAARFRTAEYRGEVELAGICETASVAADPLRLRQILVNLLVNGAKYGGRPARVRIGAAETGRGTVRFEVCDNGSGVPPERRADLFRDFERLGAETSGLEGAGLGLALSHEIARLQSGTLGVGDGEFGGGLFWLELPLWSEKAVAA